MYVYKGMCYVDNISEEDIRKVTADEAFDILEEWMDAVDDMLARVALSYAKGDFPACTYRDLKESKEILQKGWEYIQNDASTDYYVVQKVAIPEDADRLAWYAKLTCRAICVSIQAPVRHFCEKLTLENGAEMKEYTVEEPALKSICYDGEIDEQTDYDQWNAVHKNVKYTNEHCRIFKCKQCGNITTALKSYDEKMTSKGLKPVQRCLACRREHRKEK